MNKTDGTWRLIYVGPAGQLIGSLKPPQTTQGLFGVPGIGIAGGAQAGGFGGIFGSSQQGQNPPQGATGTQQPGAPGQSGTGVPAGTTGDTGGNPNAPAPIDTSNFVGGNIIGIGSKVDKKSVMIYEKAGNYHLFEFIWDPSKDMMTIGGAPGVPTGLPGQNPPGQGFGFGQGQQGQGQGQNGTGTQPGTQPSTPPANQGTQPSPSQPPVMPPLAPEPTPPQ
jgi:hypothetical protein